MLHLLLAGCWLILGAALLVWDWSDRSASAVSLWESSSALGWFGLAMALYNLLRWWLGRSHRTKGRANASAPKQPARSSPRAATRRYAI